MSSSIHSVSDNLVQISARRFQPSPFQPCWDHEGMVLGVYAGRTYPIAVGDDPIKKYWILRRKSVLYDVPERPVEISGPDAVAFLEKICARKISTLRPGRGRYAILCTPQGGIFMDGVVFRLAEDRFWFVQPDGALDEWLVAFSDGFNVAITDPHSRVLQIQGPTSSAVIHDATGGAIGEYFRYFHSGFFEIGGQTVYVSRTGWTGEIGYEIYSKGDATDCPRLWESLFVAGKAHGMEFGSIPSMEIRRIEAGILDNLTDMDRTITPFAAGLGSFIDLDKPNFIGRDALLSAPRDCRLFGLKCPDTIPRMNDVVTNDRELAGRVTAGAWSPYLATGIGYVRFKESGDWVGRRAMRLGARDGREYACEIVSLPFYDPEKRIPRGLDRPSV